MRAGEVQWMCYTKVPEKGRKIILFRGLKEDPRHVFEEIDSIDYHKYTGIVYWTYKKETEGDINDSATTV